MKKTSGPNKTIISEEKYRRYFWRLDVLRLNNSIINRKLYWRHNNAKYHHNIILRICLLLLTILPFKAEFISLKYRILKQPMSMLKDRDIPFTLRKLIKIFLLLLGVPLYFSGVFLLKDYILIRYWLIKGFILDNSSRKKPVSLL